MPGVTDQIVDGLVHQTDDVARATRGQIKTVLDRLRKLEKDAVALIRKIDPTEPARAGDRANRVDRLDSELRDPLREAYDDIDRETEQGRRGLTRAEAAAVIAGVNAAVGATILTRSLTKDAVREIARNVLVDGHPIANRWRAQRDALRQRIVGAVRQAHDRDAPLREMVAGVRGTRALGFTDGVMAQARRHAETLTRTGVNGSTQAARHRVFQRNRDVMRGEQWIAQRETACPQCLPWSGGAWDMDGNPLDESEVQMPFPGSPPVHPNCRCELAPILKRASELERGQSAKARRIAELSPDKKAALNGRLAPNEDLVSWLRRQPEAVQIERLGRGRYELWQAGELGLRDIVDPAGNLLTVDQFRAKVTQQELIDTRFGRSRTLAPGIGRQP